MLSGKLSEVVLFNRNMIDIFQNIIFKQIFLSGNPYNVNSFLFFQSFITDSCLRK